MHRLFDSDLERFYMFYVYAPTIQLSCSTATSTVSGAVLII